MDIIENKTYWDVRDLAELARENFEIFDDENTSTDDKADAERVLKVLGDALVSFGRQEFIPRTKAQHVELWGHPDLEDEDIPEYVYGEDIADLWIALGDNVHVTLIIDHEVEEYVEDMANDFGWLSDETPDFIKSAIDWSKVADTMKVNSEGGSIELDGQTYWVGL